MNPSARLEQDLTDWLRETAVPNMPDYADDILAKTDRAAMMVSLEGRAAFLDNDVVDFCARLPHGYKYRRGTRKFLLKQAMRGVLPDDIIDRRKKGFGIPLARWLRRMPTKPPLAA